MNLKDKVKAYFKPTEKKSVDYFLRGYGSGAGFPDILTDKACLDAYLYTPEVRSVIDYSADSFAEFKYNQTIEGEQVFDTPLLNLLKNPNPIQSGQSFKKQIYKDLHVFGRAYVLKIAPSAFESNVDRVTHIWALNPTNVQPIINESKTYYDIDNVIEGYNVTINGSTTFIDKDAIIHLQYDTVGATSLKDMATGISPLKTLTKPISNINISYEAQHTLLANRGALGILSTDNGDSMPLRPTEKESLQEEFSKYGLRASQSHIIMSNASLRWQQMAYPVKDLQLFETIENNHRSICNVLKFPILLMNYLNGSTFSNMETADKLLYTKKIIPEANAFVSKISNSFKDIELTADFGHIEALQPDRLIELEKDEKFIDILIKLLEAIQEGTMSTFTAERVLVNQMDISEEYAKDLLTKPTANEMPKAEQSGDV